MFADKLHLSMENNEKRPRQVIPYIRARETRSTEAHLGPIKK